MGFTEDESVMPPPSVLRKRTDEELPPSLRTEDVADLPPSLRVQDAPPSLRSEVDDLPPSLRVSTVNQPEVVPPKEGFAKLAEDVKGLPAAAGKRWLQTTGELLTPSLDMPATKKTAQSLISGVSGTLSGMAGMIPAMEARLGIKTGVGKGAMALSGALEKLGQEVAPDNPELLDKTVEGFGSMASFLLPGAGAARLARLASALPKVARGLQISLPVLLEAGTEQGALFKELKAKGYNDIEAGKMAFKNFWSNAAVIAAANMFGISSKEVNALKKFAKSAPAEAFSEFSENVFAGAAEGDKDRIAYSLQNLAEQAQKPQSAEAAVIGGIVGGGTGAVTVGGTVSQTVGEKGTNYLRERFPGFAEGVLEKNIPAKEEDIVLALERAATAGEAVLLQNGTPQEAEMAAAEAFFREIEGKIEQPRNVPPPIEESLDRVEVSEEIENADIAEAQIEPLDITLPDSTRTTVQDTEIRSKAKRLLDENRSQRAPEAQSMVRELREGGVEQGNLIRDAEGNVTGRFGRSSTNPQWYRDMFATVEGVNKDQLTRALEKYEAGDALTERQQQLVDDAFRFADEAESALDPEYQPPPRLTPKEAIEQAKRELEYEAQMSAVREQAQIDQELAQGVVEQMPQLVTAGQIRAREAANEMLRTNRIDNRVAVDFVDSIILGNASEVAALQQGRPGLDPDQANIRGSFTPVDTLNAVIKLTQSADVETGYHEAFHAVERFLLNDAQRNALIRKYGKEGESAVQSMETVADAYAEYAKQGTTYDNVVDRIFYRIRQFIERMGNWLARNGVQSADDIFSGIRYGSFAAPQKLEQSALFSATEGSPALKAINDEYTPDPSLTEAEKKLERRAAAYVRANPRKVFQDYADKHSFFVSTDAFREMLPGYDGKNANAFHELASALKRVYLKQVLDDAKSRGLKRVVVSAGGAGAGKTTFLRDQGYFKDDEIAAIIDSVLPKFSDAKRTLDPLIEQGFEPEILFVYRDPIKAWENGVLPRVREEGRIVPLDRHIQMHRGVPATVEKVVSEYGNRVAVEVFENVEDVGFRRSTLESIQKRSYNKGEVKEVMRNATNEALRKGNLTEEEVRSLLDTVQRPTGNQRSAPEGTEAIRGISSVEGQADQDQSVDPPQFSARPRTANPHTEESNFSPEAKAPTFYSQLKSVIEKKLPNKASAAQLKGILNSQDVKREEVEWSGITEWLEGKQTVTKAEVLDFLKENAVRVEEVLLPKMRSSDEQAAELKRLSREMQGAEDLRQEHRIEAAMELTDVEEPTKFDKYTLPGGENYRELLLTLPSGYDAAAMRIFGKKYSELSGRDKSVARDDTDEASDFESSHFSEPNILAHVRMNDRIDADGKRMLFIEELQSDWHQKGREVGYAHRGDPKRYAEIKNKMDEMLAENHVDTSDIDALYQFEVSNPEYRTLIEEGKRVHPEGGVPDAPFKKTWHELAMKRMLRWAAENGYGAIGWTTGEQQAERYDLSKQIDKLIVTKGKEGYSLTAIDHEARSVLNSKFVRDNELENTIGKDLAKKIREQKETDKEYSGIDLTIGGEGMVGFYDKMLPAFVNKYAKKWGGRVQSAKIKTGEGKIYERGIDAPATVNPVMREVHAIDITPSMFDSVLKVGQPLFSAEIKPSGEPNIPKEVYDQVAEKPPISEGITANVKDAFGEYIEGAENVMTPISTRLKNINPEIKTRLRKAEIDIRLKMSADLEKADAFLRKKKSMSAADKRVFDLAQKNGDPTAMMPLVMKYKMGQEYFTVRNMLNDIHKRATEVDFEVGYRENYFPRKLKNSRAFLEYMQKDPERWSDLQKAILDKEAELERALTDDEKAHLINTLIRGYGRKQVALSRTGNMKGREIEYVDAHLNEFYQDSDTALVSYIFETNEAIEARKFFGKGNKDLVFPNIDDSIGHLVNKLLVERKIQPTDEKLLKDVLRARFAYAHTSSAVALTKNLIYIGTIGNPISAITQFEDLAISAYRAGFPRAFANFARAVTGKSKIKLKDLGFEPLSEEFRDGKKTAKALRKFLDAVGFTAMDRIGKETFVNSVIDKYRNMAKQGDESFRQRIEPIFGDQTDQVIMDLKSGEMSDDIVYLAANELLDIQPIALSEMPLKYLESPGGRLFYTLKTFQIKRLDLYRNEIFNAPNKKESFKRAMQLAFWVMLMGGTTDEIKDIVLRRETSLSDRVIDNFLKLFGFSKFDAWKARQEGIGSAAMRKILPPLVYLDEGWKDFGYDGNFWKGKGLELPQRIPVAGKLYYWWLGKGVEKRKRELAKIGKKNSTGRRTARRQPVSRRRAERRQKVSR